MRAAYVNLLTLKCQNFLCQTKALWQIKSFDHFLTQKVVRKIFSEAQQVAIFDHRGILRIQPLRVKKPKKYSHQYTQFWLRPCPRWPRVWQISWVVLRRHWFDRALWVQIERAVSTRFDCSELADSRCAPRSCHTIVIAICSNNGHCLTHTRQIRVLTIPQ